MYVTYVVNGSKLLYSLTKNSYFISLLYLLVYCIWRVKLVGNRWASKSKSFIACRILAHFQYANFHECNWKKDSDIALQEGPFRVFVSRYVSALSPRLRTESVLRVTLVPAAHRVLYPAPEWPDASALSARAPFPRRARAAANAPRLSSRVCPRSDATRANANALTAHCAICRRGSSSSPVIAHPHAHCASWRKLVRAPVLLLSGEEQCCCCCCWRWCLRCSLPQNAAEHFQRCTQSDGTHAHVTGAHQCDS